MPAGQQLAQPLDDPTLAVALLRREAHAEEVELHARTTLDDREVVLEDRVRVGVPDHDTRRVRALLLEHRELVEADG